MENVINLNGKKIMPKQLRKTVAETFKRQDADMTPDEFVTKLEENVINTLANKMFNIFVTAINDFLKGGTNVRKQNPRRTR